MARRLGVRSTETHTIALWDLGGSLMIETWHKETDERQVLETWSYEGYEDRSAAIALARGTLTSVTRQIKDGSL